MITIIFTNFQKSKDMILIEIFTKVTEVVLVNSEAWIPLVVAAIGAGVSAYSAYEKSKASTALRAANESTVRQQQDLASVYNRESNKDAFSSASAKGAVSRITEQMRKANKKADDATATGATQEAKVATKASNTEAYANAMRNIGAQGERYQDSMRSRYEGMLGGQIAANDATIGRDVTSWGNLQSNAFNTLSSGLQSMEPSGTKKTKEDN